MRTDNDYIRIDTAANLTGKSIATIYRMIKDKKVKAVNKNVDGKILKVIHRNELIRVFPHIALKPDISNITADENKNNNNNQNNNYSQNDNDNETHNNIDVREEIRLAITEFFETKQTQLMKPLEDQAIYIAGKLRAENSFLQAKVETLLEENTKLQESMKSLPDLQFVQTLQAELKLKNEALAHAETEKQSAVSELQKKIDELSLPWWKRLF